MTVMPTTAGLARREVGRGLDPALLRRGEYRREGTDEQYHQRDQTDGGSQQSTHQVGKASIVAHVTPWRSGGRTARCPIAVAPSLVSAGESAWHCLDAPLLSRRSKAAARPIFLPRPGRKVPAPPAGGCPLGTGVELRTGQHRSPHPAGDGVDPLTRPADAA